MHTSKQSPRQGRRRAIALIPFLVFFLGYGFSQEIGLDSTTKLTLGNPDSTLFTLGERLDGWWKLPFDKSGSVFEGSAHFGMAMNIEGETISPVPTGDLDRLRLAFILPKPVVDMKSMDLEFGRLPVKDPTGLIVSHPADGAMIGFDYSFLKINVQAGFTGLVLRNANTISLTLFDQTTAVNEELLFGTSRFLVKAQVDFPDIYKHSVNLSFLAQQDLNPDSDSDLILNFIPEWTIVRDSSSPPKGGKLDTQYSSIKASGPIPVIGNLFYDVWFSYGSGRTLTWLADDSSSSGFSYQYVPISSFMTGLSVDYFMPALLSSTFNFRFLFASGDADYSGATEGNTEGVATQFIPITVTTLGAAFSPRLSNLIVAEISGSVKPLEKERIQTGLKLLAFFRPTVGPLDVSGLAPGEISPLLGFEADIFGNYRIMSDLGVSLSTGIFFPGISPSGAFVSGSPVRYSVQIAVTLGI